MFFVNPFRSYLSKNTLKGESVKKIAVLLVFVLGSIQGRTIAEQDRLALLKIQYHYANDYVGTVARPGSFGQPPSSEYQQALEVQKEVAAEYHAALKEFFSKK